MAERTRATISDVALEIQALTRALTLVDMRVVPPRSRAEDEEEDLHLPESLENPAQHRERPPSGEEALGLEEAPDDFTPDESTGARDDALATLHGDEEIAVREEDAGSVASHELHSEDVDAIEQPFDDHGASSHEDSQALFVDDEVDDAEIPGVDDRGVEGLDEADAEVDESQLPAMDSDSLAETELSDLFDELGFGAPVVWEIETLDEGSGASDPPPGPREDGLLAASGSERLVARGTSLELKVPGARTVAIDLASVGLSTPLAGCALGKGLPRFLVVATREDGGLGVVTPHFTSGEVGPLVAVDVTGRVTHLVATWDPVAEVVRIRGSFGALTLRPRAHH
jgi:hypothetical protein